MRFGVMPEIFEKFPTYSVGVVVAHGIDNRVSFDTKALLESACENARKAVGGSPRTHPMIKVWRDAFLSIGYNPNRFQPSIDALVSRVAKSHSVPCINPAVDILNAHSLSHLLPMGAHDLDRMSGDFLVRHSEAGEVFEPMGGAKTESVDAGEFVYADSAEVRTRRWIWRQGDNAKVTEQTTILFCPIDGFGDFNLDAVLEARASVARALAENLGAEVREYLVERSNPMVKIL